MKSVLALALVGAVAAVPAWSDAPVDPAKVTTTTTVASTWADVPVKTTTTTKPVAIKTTTTDPWADVVKPTTTTTKPVAVTTPVTWSDYVPATVTTTVVNVITTYCPYATTFTDKGDVYTVTKATTLTLTKGPYTVTIPVYEETSTVCDTPVAPTAAASTWVDVSVPVAPTGKVTAVAPSAAPVKPSSVQPVSPYTGSASKMAGAGLAGVAAIAALLL